MTNAKMLKTEEEKKIKRQKTNHTLKLTMKLQKWNKRRGIKESFYENYIDIWEGRNHVLWHANH